MKLKIGTLFSGIGTLFSGIGAFEQSLKQSKIKHTIEFACDFDKFVKQSYLANYITKKWFDDVKEMSGKEFENKIDILVGGSSCQSFSIAGERKGLKDLRGILIFEFIRLVKRKLNLKYSFLKMWKD